MAQDLKDQLASLKIDRSGADEAEGGRGKLWVGIGVAVLVAGALEFRVELLLNQDLLQRSPTPELAELMEIAAQPESWLAQLLADHAALFLPPQAPKTAKVDPTLPLIQTVSLEPEEAPQLGYAELESWRQQLKQLVLRYRESLSEC